MWTTVALFFLCLCPLSYGQYCNSDGPGICFQQGWCSWGTDDAAWVWGCYGSCVRLNNSKFNGTLYSRVACSTQRRTDCLRFRYRFTVNNTITLNVYVNNNVTGERVKRWSLSAVPRLYVWYNAFIPITTNFPFTVEIEAVRHSENTLGIVFVDYIVYRQNSSCLLQPPNAEVPTTPTAENTSSIGEIVGPIIAVLVIIIIIVVVFLYVLYRRNKLQNITVCFKSAKNRETHSVMAVNNSAYNPHAIGSEESDTAGIDGAQHQTHVSPSQSPHNNYNVQDQNSTHIHTLTTTDENSEVNKKNKPQKAQKPSSQPPAQYDLAKAVKPKPNKPEAGKTNNSIYEVAHTPSEAIYHVPDTTQSEDVYHVPDDAEAGGVYSVQGASGPHTTDEYNSLHHDGKGKNVQGYTGDGAVYSHLQTGEEGEYNSLHHDGKRGNTQEYTGGAVYSHLQAGEEGDYRQLDRGNKVKVIDDEYSHASQI